MSKYQEWQVWKDAVEVGVEVMQTDIPELLEIQMKQTAISISCKIAEGATGYKLGYINAKKATAKLETYLILLHKFSKVLVDEQLESLLSKLDGIHKQLSALMRKVSY